MVILMTEYVCRDCSGRSATVISFKVWEDGYEYQKGSLCCPICGHYDTVMTYKRYQEYREQYD